MKPKLYKVTEQQVAIWWGANYPLYGPLSGMSPLEIIDQIKAEKITYKGIPVRLKNRLNSQICEKNYVVYDKT